MKNRIILFATALALAIFASCNANTEGASKTASANASTEVGAGQSGVKDDVSQQDVVKIAVGSKDHTTLVTAVKAAELVDALSNAGPFTVFAPTNAAFEKLPKGTVEGLLKPDQKAALTTILQYHVYVGAMRKDYFTDGQSLGMVDGGNVTIHINGDKIMVNDATIIATVPASNGIVHVIDGVLLPPKK